MPRHRCSVDQNARQQAEEKKVGKAKDTSAALCEVPTQVELPSRRNVSLRSTEAYQSWNIAMDILNADHPLIAKRETD